MRIVVRRLIYIMGVDLFRVEKEVFFRWCICNFLGMIVLIFSFRINIIKVSMIRNEFVEIKVGFEYGVLFFL